MRDVGSDQVAGVGAGLGLDDAQVEAQPGAVVELGEVLADRLASFDGLSSRGQSDRVLRVEPLAQLVELPLVEQDGELLADGLDSGLVLFRHESDSPGSVIGTTRSRRQSSTRSVGGIS
jgi:hypothetical protein